MKTDFQISIAGYVETDERDGSLEGSRILAEFQRNLLINAGVRDIKIDGITLGWKERQLSPLEQMQLLEQQQTGKASVQYDPLAHGGADEPVAAVAPQKVEAQAESGNPAAPQPSDAQILAEKARLSLHGQ